jgi:hypothetical protein
MLSGGYISGGLGGVIVGAGMIIWGKRLGIKMDVEQLR